MKRILIIIHFVFLLTVFLNHGAASGSEMKITGLSISPSLPQPSQEVTLRVDMEASSVDRVGDKVILYDVFGKEIASQMIPSDFPLKGSINIPFTAPASQGRYNYNIQVSIGPAYSFINVPVSSGPLISVMVEKMGVRFESGKLVLSFQVKNSGNKTINNFKASGIINPAIGEFTGKDIAEVIIGEELITSLDRDAFRKVEMSMPVSERQWLLGMKQDTFWVGINISGWGERPYWKVGKYRIEDGAPVVVPLHSLSAHTFYTEHAINIFPAGSALYQELSLYRDQLIAGTFDEDYPPDLVYDETWPFLYIHHFLDYDNHPFYSGLSGTGLYIPLVSGNYVESAYEKAMAYWDGWTLNSVYHPGVVELYLGIGLPYPDKITAYEYLGRMAHLIEDMLTPAHVHSDMHGIPLDDDEFEEVYEPGIDPATGMPRYEKYDENSAVWAYWRDYIGNRNFVDFAELFTKINNHTDYFPSDDAEGDDANFSNPWNIPRLYSSDIIRYDIFGIDHYKLPGMQNLADRVSPLNVMSVAAIYKFFWDATR